MEMPSPAAGSTRSRSVLFVTAHDPRRSSGAGLVVRGRLRSLRRLGCRVTLLLETDERDDAGLEAFVDDTHLVHTRGFSMADLTHGAWRLVTSGYVPKWSAVTWRRLSALVDAIEPEAIFLDDLRLAEHGRLLLRMRCAARVIIHEHNVEHELLARQRAFTRAIGKRLELGVRMRRFRAMESTLSELGDAIVALTEDDRQTLARLSPTADVRCIPPDVDLDHYALESDERTTCELLFIGSLNWAANRDGMEWLLREIWPAVLRAVPEARLTVVGRNPPAWLARDHSRVDAVGFVDDERLYYRRARALVVPLRFGSGVRIKILNALAMGTPVVSTRLGAEGVPVVDGESILLADEPAAFAAALVRLLSDEPEARRIAAAAHQICRAHYAPAVVDRRIAEVLTAELRSSSGHRR